MNGPALPDTGTHDARYCALVAHKHARTFSLASRLLPREKRRAAYALYAFCRVADDLVDSGDGDTLNERALQLKAYECQLHDALDGRSAGPVFREVARVVDLYRVPAAPLFELLRGVAHDLTPQRYPTWASLEQYCEGVASSVGEMCTHVFGVNGGDDVRQAAVRYARTLGVAMQLTNILRDVGEDARLGRCYLPDDELADFGLAINDVLALPDAGTFNGLAADSRWKRFMAFQVERARMLYQRAHPGIGLLARDAQRCAAACAMGYAGILDVIVAQDFDTLNQRARVGSAGRARILWNAWRFRAPSLHTTHDVHGAPDAHVAWDGGMTT